MQTVEERLPPESMIFQLPVLMFPETPSNYDLGHYQLEMGYLHSTRLRWGAAAMRGRPAARWQAELAKQLEQSDSLAAATAELEQAGFQALWVDLLGYAPKNAPPCAND